MLNNQGDAHHIEGARAVVAFPGGSPDFDLSRDRVEGYTKQIREEFGVEMLGSAAEVAQNCDAVIIHAVDGRTHLKLFQEVAPLGKPVFIDKPFTTTSADAIAIAELARKYSVRLMSCSSLRYARPLVEALAGNEEIVGADCSGPMDIKPTQPGLFWYGIHSVEMLYRILGRGCATVCAATTEKQELVTGVWKDGRIGTVRGSRYGNWTFNALLSYPQEMRYVAASPAEPPTYYTMLLDILTMFRGAAPSIDIEETLEIVRFIEAANESRESGAVVAL
jgi:predicted dehydrogenase